MAPLAVNITALPPSPASSPIPLNNAYLVMQILGALAMVVSAGFLGLEWWRNRSSAQALEAYQETVRSFTEALDRSTKANEAMAIALEKLCRPSPSPSPPPPPPPPPPPSPSPSPPPPPPPPPPGRVLDPEAASPPRMAAQAARVAALARHTPAPALAPSPASLLSSTSSMRRRKAHSSESQNS
ncbi:hypothetical protein P171DRAFT_479217 [Karstenula rhodostoma CBS 690.94]|uniref:Uncharacterized protein n=1 Tax=Karstenula rhodostoma CBS 690.94 TaxID=1392251 RepID=A0A9P4Q0E6_9PLEO|nr:hypothetical protein P171DRAFT_479217 [Karstenula rhodostoma CBS 690.94]